jgi:hypothetical protein
MSIATVQGSLVIVGANGPNAQVFFNGVLVPGVTKIVLSWEKNEQRVKLRVTEMEQIHRELKSAGIRIVVENKV